MHRFRVWARNLAKIAVRIANARYPLQRHDGGWWQGNVEAAQPGTDYAFFLDDEDLALPHPPSPGQPSGVRSPSRLLDHTAFQWTDARFEAPPLPSGIIYELHIG